MPFQIRKEWNEIGDKFMFQSFANCLKNFTICNEISVLLFLTSAYRKRSTFLG